MSEIKIEILGTGCPKCQQLTEAVEKAVEELRIEAEIVKITDMIKIMSHDITMTPGLVVNGLIKSAGKLLSVEEIKEIIEYELQQ